MVHGDKDWARDYEKMSEDIVWSGVEDITEPADGDHMEEEAMIDRVVVSHDGDIIFWPRLRPRPTHGQGRGPIPACASRQDQ